MASLRVRRGGSPYLPQGFDAVRAEDPAAWDTFVLAHGGHLLQSASWGALKSRFGWQVLRLLLLRDSEPAAGAQVLFRPTPLGTLAYVPRGPVVAFDRQDDLVALFEAIHAAARHRRSFALKVEPNVASTRDAAGMHPSSPAERLRGLGFRASSGGIQPASTIFLDLRPDLAKLASQQKAKTRYNIGLAARRGVVVRQGTAADLPGFHAAMELTGRRDGFAIHSRSYYQAVLEALGDGARLFVAEFAGELLGGILVARFGWEAIYLYGASTDAYRNLMPNYLLQWEAMCWAKAQGCLTYDMWGIPDEAVDLDESGERRGETARAPENPQGGLWGVYRFKQGFGGRAMRLAGAFDYVYSPWRYALWRWLLALRRSPRGRA